MSDPQRDLLRHMLATMAYRGGKAVRQAPEAFAGYRAGETTRTPAQILAHIGDLLDWALTIVQGQEKFHESTPLAWDGEVARFFGALAALDAALASPTPPAASAEKLFQGPIADAFTHIGQIAMLRRMAGAPIRGENYMRAGIAAGRVGADQAAAVREFD